MEKFQETNIFTGKTGSGDNNIGIKPVFQLYKPD